MESTIHVELASHAVTTIYFPRSSRPYLVTISYKSEQLRPLTIYDSNDEFAHIRSGDLITTFTIKRSTELTPLYFWTLHSGIITLQSRQLPDPDLITSAPTNLPRSHLASTEQRYLDTLAEHLHSMTPTPAPAPASKPSKPTPTPPPTPIPPVVQLPQTQKTPVPSPVRSPIRVTREPPQPIHPSPTITRQPSRESILLEPLPQPLQDPPLNRSPYTDFSKIVDELFTPRSRTSSRDIHEFPVDPSPFIRKREPNKFEDTSHVFPKKDPIPTKKKSTNSFTIRPQPLLQSRRNSQSSDNLN